MRYVCDLRVPVVADKLFSRHVVHGLAAAVRGSQLQKKLDEGRFARARRADDTDGFTRGHGEADARQNRSPRRVRIADVFKGDRTDIAKAAIARHRGARRVALQRLCTRSTNGKS